jgi:predicted phage terminase large subunit-like protein
MDYIDFLRSTMGVDFYSQYMNQPIDVETQVIKREYFKYFRRKPDGLYVCVTVDPALSYAQRSDYTAIMVCGMDSQRNIYVLDYLRGHWGSPGEIITNILSMCDKWKPVGLGIEMNVFQKALGFWMEELTLKRRHIPNVTSLKAPPTKSKDMRMKALEPYYRNGMVYHHETMKGKDLENELLSMTTDGFKGKHDDLFDALAWQLEMLVGGSESMPSQVEPGTWEWEAREARKMMRSPYQNFLNN